MTVFPLFSRSVRHYPSDPDNTCLHFIMSFHFFQTFLIELIHFLQSSFILHLFLSINVGGKSIKKDRFRSPSLYLWFFFLVVYPRPVKIPAETNGADPQKENGKESRPRRRFHACHGTENTNHNASQNSRHGVNIRI